mmetsp:Transcript_6695/g.10426  ORF Transcript_6695/g.10426 Transcript_6695/m.10426 type:complete len:245 (+) Transcript_6695:592-1326(+)
MITLALQRVLGHSIRKLAVTLSERLSKVAEQHMSICFNLDFALSIQCQTVSLPIKCLSSNTLTRSLVANAKLLKQSKELITFPLAEATHSQQLSIAFHEGWQRCIFDFCICGTWCRSNLFGKGGGSDRGLASTLPLLLSVSAAICSQAFGIRVLLFTCAGPILSPFVLLITIRFTSRRSFVIFNGLACTHALAQDAVLGRLIIFVSVPQELPELLRVLVCALGCACCCSRDMHGHRHHHLCRPL